MIRFWASVAGPRVRIELSGNGLVAGGPDLLPVDVHLVGDAAAALQPGQQDERVVMAGHLEGAGLGVEHPDGGRGVGLHPHRGRRLADVAQHGTQDE